MRKLMPTCLKDFLAKLPIKDNDEVWEWLDSNPNVVVSRMMAIVESKKKSVKRLSANAALYAARRLFGKRGDIRSDGETYEIGIETAAGFVCHGASRASWNEALARAANNPPEKMVRMSNVMKTKRA